MSFVELAICSIGYVMLGSFATFMVMKDRVKVITKVVEKVHEDGSLH